MASFRQIDIKRVLEAALKLGVTVTGYRIASDGNIEVQMTPPRQVGDHAQLLDAEEKAHG